MSPKPTLTFSAADLSLIAELLDISSHSLAEAITRGRSHYPKGPLLARLCALQSGSADLQERISSSLVG